MVKFTFELTEDQIKVWQRYAQVKGCTLEHLIQVLIPHMTGELLFTMVNPEACDRLDEVVLAELPTEMQEILVRQWMELNQKLRECQPQEE